MFSLGQIWIYIKKSDIVSVKTNKFFKKFIFVIHDFFFYLEYHIISKLS